MADNDQSLYNLRYNQVENRMEAFGGGTPTWTPLSIGGGGGTPGGANTQVQFNNSGVFGGSADLTWDGAALSAIQIVTDQISNPDNLDISAGDGFVNLFGDGDANSSLQFRSDESVIAFWNAAGTGMYHGTIHAGATDIAITSRGGRSIIIRTDENGTNREWTFDPSGNFTAGGDAFILSVANISALSGTDLILSSPDADVVIESPTGNINIVSTTGVAVTGTTTFDKACVMPTVAYVASTATPVTPDARDIEVYNVTVDANLTINGPSNPYSGQKMLFQLHNDAVSAVTFATGAGNFRFGTDIPSYTASASLTDYVGAVYNSADNRWDIVSLVQGF